MKKLNRFLNTHITTSTVPSFVSMHFISCFDAFKKVSFSIGMHKSPPSSALSSLCFWSSLEKEVAQIDVLTITIGFTESTPATFSQMKAVIDSFIR